MAKRKSKNTHDVSDDYNEACQSNQHYTNLTPEVDHIYHRTKRFKSEYNSNKPNESICWINSNHEKSIVKNEELKKFVEEDDAPAGVVFIDFNNEYMAETNTRIDHLFTNSCVLTGCARGGKNEIEIKISSKTCLGMREFNLAKENMGGCLNVLAIYELGDYNIFIREKPAARLSELIATDDTRIKAEKLIIELAEIINSLHDNYMYVRFIVSENVAFVGTEKLNAKFEEFNTITFMDGREQKSSDEDSGGEFNQIINSKFKALTIENKVEYNRESEISIFGQLIYELTTIQRFAWLKSFALSVSKNNYTLKEIVYHPILQSTREYFHYIDVLTQSLNAAGSFDLKREFQRIHKELFNGKRGLQPFCRALLKNGKQILGGDKPNYLSFKLLKSEYVSDKIEAIALLSKKYEIIIVQHWWKHDFAHKYKDRDSFMEKLRFESCDFIESVHEVTLKMFKSTDGLCIPPKKED